MKKIWERDSDSVSEDSQEEVLSPSQLFPSSQFDSTEEEGSEKEGAEKEERAGETPSHKGVVISQAGKGAVWPRKLLLDSDPLLRPIGSERRERRSSSSTDSSSTDSLSSSRRRAVAASQGLDVFSPEFTPSKKR